MPKKTKLKPIPKNDEDLKQSRSQAIVEAFDEFIKTHDADLRQKAINYAFLAGMSYQSIYNSLNKGQSETNRTPVNTSLNPTLSFDKISDVYANVLGTFPEAIPKVGVVKRIDSPINDSVVESQQNIIDYHIENQWDIKGNQIRELMPNLYPGGVCYCKVFPRLTGTRKVVVDKAENIIPNAVVNDDGSIRIAGKTTPDSATKTDPQKAKSQSIAKIEGTIHPGKLAKLGYSITEIPEFIVDFEYVPVFDVAIVGKIKTPQKCIKIIHHQVITISDLISMFGSDDFKAQHKIIRELADNMPEKQDKAPQSKTEKYLTGVGLCTETERNLYGDDRMLNLWTEWHNPSSEFPKGRYTMVISEGATPIFLWESTELFGATDYIPWGAFILDGNPATSAVKKSPMEAMIAPQVARDRILNARTALECKNANPPERILDGMEFSIDGEQFQKIFDFPEDKTVYYRLNEDAKAALKAGLPIRLPIEYAQMGTVDTFLAILDEQFRNASHQRSMGTGALPVQVSGTSIENQYAIDKLDLTPQLQMMQQTYYDVIKLASQMMKSVYHPGQRFRFSGGDDEIEDAVWIQEHSGDELDFVLKSQIGQPLTKQAKLQEIQTKIALMQSAQEAGADIGELLEAMNMREFAYSFAQEDPQYTFAKSRLLKITKGIKPPEVQDLAAIPVHVAVVAGEITSRRFPQYDKDVQDMLNKELLILVAMQKQKEGLSMAVNQPPPGTPPMAQPEQPSIEQPEQTPAPVPEQQ